MKFCTVYLRAAFVIGVFLLIPFVVPAQDNSWSDAWSYPLPPTGETLGGGITFDGAGNYYVGGGGRDSSNVHYYSSFLLKYNSSNQLIWRRDFTAFGKRIVNAGLKMDEKGRLFVFGSFGNYYSIAEPLTNATLLVDTLVTTTGRGDAFLMQIDTSGQTVWLRTYGGAEVEEFRGMSVANNKILLTGVYDDTLRLGANIIMHEPLNKQREFYALFDTDGNPLWAKTVRSAYQITSVTIAKDKSMYMTGTFSFDLYLDNVHIIDGSSGNVVETGFLAKFDSTGNCIWAKSQNGLGGPTGQGNVSFVQTNQVISHPNGEISVSGIYYNCRLHLTNSILSLPESFQNTPFLVRYNANGTGLWIKGGQVGSFNYAGGIATDSQSNIYLTGGMNLPGTFGTDTFSNYGRGKHDAFLLKYSPAGKLIWGRTAGADLEDVGYGVTLSPDESSVYMVGTARSNNPMYFGSIQVPLAGSSTMFIGKATNAPLAITKIAKSDFAFTVFPNPATTVLNLRLPVGIAVQGAAIYNSLGNMIFQWSGLAAKSELNLRLPELPAGTYTLLLRSSAGTQSHCKVVINP